ncbi:MAG: hypothetical protein H7330_15920 [Hymenobacteraceae bacterium]|nr:hypothetical protein [Hymenobacteraceae bacterium]
MTTQLTLTLDTAVLAQAEAAARAAGLDLTAFLEKLVQEARPPAAPTDDLPLLPPGVQALRGILSLPPDADYKQLAGEHLWEKYGK